MRVARVTTNLKTIKTVMEGEVYTYDLTGEGCTKGVFGYTYKGTRKIWLCGRFWSAPDSGRDSKPGTLLHEQSHACARTDDIAYGPTKCRTLAVDHPNRAARNADSYEYFAELGKTADLESPERLEPALAEPVGS